MNNLKNGTLKDQFTLFCDILRYEDGISVRAASHQVMRVGDIRLELVIDELKWCILKKCLYRGCSRSCGSAFVHREKDSDDTPGMKEVSLLIECAEHVVNAAFQPYVYETMNHFGLMSPPKVYSFPAVSPATKTLAAPHQILETAA